MASHRDNLHQAELCLIRGEKVFAAREYRRAANTFRRAVELEPEAGISKLALGRALFAIGEFQPAAQATRRGLDRIDDLASFDHNPLHSYSVSDDFERHCSELQEYVESNPEDADVHFLLGYNLLGTGQYGAAVRHFDRALEINGNDYQSAHLKQTAVGRQTLLAPVQHRRPTRHRRVNSQSR